MIGPIAQGALLMGVIYWYSKCMFGMINDYYREEFKKNVILQQPEKLQKLQESSLLSHSEKLVDDISQVDIKLQTPSTPSIQGLSNVLIENNVLHHESGILTRNLNDKLSPNKKQLTNKENHQQIINNNNIEQNKMAAKQGKHSNIDGNKSERMTSNIATMSQEKMGDYLIQSNEFIQTSKDLKLLNSKELNNNHAKCMTKSTAATTANSCSPLQFAASIKALTDKIDCDISSSTSTTTTTVTDYIHSKNDVIGAIEKQKPISNPSVVNKLNYVNNVDQQVSIIDVNKKTEKSKPKPRQKPKQTQEQRCCVIVENECNRNEAEGNLKLAINWSSDDKSQFKDIQKDVVDVNKNFHLPNPNSINNKNALNKINGNDAASTTADAKFIRNVVTTNDEVILSSNMPTNFHLIDAVTNKHPINTRLLPTDTTIPTNHYREPYSCRRKSVSEYITFWSNLDKN